MDPGSIINAQILSDEPLYVVSHVFHGLKLGGYVRLVVDADLEPVGDEMLLVVSPGGF